MPGPSMVALKRLSCYLLQKPSSKPWGLHQNRPTFRCVHALLHGASWLKHRCFEVSHRGEHLLKATASWYNATLWVGILRNLRKHS